MTTLEDKEAIRDLVMSYCRGVDRQDFALLRSLYTDDAAEDDHGGLYSGSAAGYVAWLEGVMPRLGITSHNVTNHLISLDDEVSAQGEVYCIAYHRMPVDGGCWEDLVHGMRYLDHYAKGSDGRWRFARRSVAVDWKQMGPCTWHPTASNAGKALKGAHGAGDPSYSVLSNPLFERHR